MLDKYLYSMQDASIKFPAVVTIKEVLGIEEGTVLRFDWSSGKYVSIDEVEDIADDYYYSGYAIAIDPYIVKDNIGTYFVHVASDGSDTTINGPSTLENVEVSKTQVYTDEDAKAQVDEGATAPTPTVTEKHALVIDCDCGARRLLQVFDSAGANFTLMANDESSYIELSCVECGSSMKLWFAPDDEINWETNVPITEESIQGYPLL